MRIFACLLLVAVVAGCASARRGEAFDAEVKLTSPELVQGQKVFMAHCNPCHPGGEAGLGPALNNKPLPPAAIAFQVRHGLGVMPAFDESKISDAELEALTRYLVALRHVPAPQEP